MYFKKVITAFSTKQNILSVVSVNGTNYIEFADRNSVMSFNSTHAWNDSKLWLCKICREIELDQDSIITFMHGIWDYMIFSGI